MIQAPKRVSVLIGDDEPMIREALREVLEAEPDIEVVAVAEDVDETILLAAQHAPTVAIDVRMPNGGGARAAREIRSQSPGTRIMAFSAYGDNGIVDEMVRAGVSEYLLKGTSNAAIVAAVRRIAAA